MTYDSRSDTWRHIHEVRSKIEQVIMDLLRRSANHDQSKLVSPELEVFNEYSNKLKTSTYGSPEYKGFLTGMQEALDHHYRANDHHPEHFVGLTLDRSEKASARTQGALELPPGAGIHGMNLVQMLEMLCDWKAATMRHDDGDLYSSIQINSERFGFGEEIKNLLIYTAAYFEWL